MKQRSKLGILLVQEVKWLIIAIGWLIMIVVSTLPPFVFFLTKEGMIKIIEGLKKAEGELREIVNQLRVEGAR